MLNNQDFTQDRTKYLGGSDIGAILGLSKYRSPLDVWLEKTGKVVKEVNNLPVRFGTFAESFVADEYSRQTRFSLSLQTKAITHRDHSFLVAHIDRFAHPLNADIQGEPTHLLECKTANPFAKSEWGELGSDEVPMSYLAQCHWYLALTHLKRCDLAVLFGNSELRIYHIYKDLDLEATLLDKAIDFWQNYVQKDIAPNPQSTGDYQTLFQTESPGKVIEADEKTAQLIAYSYELSNDIHAKEEEVGTIKQHVMAVMQDAQELLYQGRLLATWKKPKASFRFDSKRFETEHPELFPNYQVPIANSRRLVLKESKAASPHQMPAPNTLGD